MKRIVALARVGLLLLTVAVFGCAEPPRGVVVWHSYRGDEQRALEVVAARFEKETGIHVSLLATPYESYLSKLEAAIPRGTCSSPGTIASILIRPASAAPARPRLDTVESRTGE